MHLQRLVPAMFVTACFAAGCDPEMVDDADRGEISLRPGGTSNGGVWLNTSSIGSTAFQEFDLTGALHDGMRLMGVKLKGPNNTWIDATGGEVVDGNLRAKVGKTVYAGAQLVGSRWLLDIVDDEGGVTPVEIWIASHTQVSPKESRYVFKTLDDNGAETFVCEADSAGQHTSIPMRDITVDAATGDMSPRSKTVYLACTSGAIGKAIVWGYRPWERSLAEFELATRMVRADYCLDGMSWTEPGIHLQVRDKYNINTFVQAADPTEVVWTTAGAACVTQPRNPLFTASQIVCDGQPLPLCPANVTMTSFPGTVFWSKNAAPQ